MFAPITHANLLDLPGRLGQSVTNIRWLLGYHPPAWSIVRLAPDELPKAPTALLARWMLDHPDDWPPMASPAPQEFHKALVAALGQNVEKKELGMLLGCEACGGYRWIGKGNKPHPAIRHAMSILLLDGLAGLAARWSAWAEMVHDEAQRRGITDLLKEGRWTPKHHEQIAA